MESTFDWMAWTPATACFFGVIALLLATMTWFALARPEVERGGILGFPTTRGDRLFLSLVLAAIVHLVWIGLFGAQTITTLPIGDGFDVSSLWLATFLSLVLAFILFRIV
jgi:predicted small integral membrane protein